MPLHFHPHDDIQGTHWVSYGPPRIVQAKRADTGDWHFGDMTLSEQELLSALPKFSPKKLTEFTLTHDGWKSAKFKSFRPLIYFCAFHDPTILECVCIAVNSLVTFGKWQYDIAILTSPDTVETLQESLSSLDVPGTLTIIPVPNTHDKLDWCLSRYNFALSDMFQHASPILYCDADIVCDHPLDDILPLLVTSPFVHACPEGRLDEGSLQSEGHWFGWRLLSGDNVPFDPFSRGFSSGILGFADARSVQDVFPLIRQAAYGWMETFGGRETLPSFDQRFANYVLRKMNMSSLDIIPQKVSLFRIPPEGQPYPSVQQRRGIVHFLGASTVKKLASMQAYVSALKERGV
ncbi:hypothetical protein [Neokomagataea thailandica]|uniref:Glycosyltransferase n=1 Tax=Neokomagataea tanensis NBRC 106556 TaxID=1223519 RepID=A0ABQ0QFM1_9PROT|nr:MULTISPECIES: hypothetical protein [Neokomagataea]GBR43200.1 hypothetical protein AA106556_0009 [Neokomagataea tanensis NBRC 106556]